MNRLTTLLAAGLLAAWLPAMAHEAKGGAAKAAPVHKEQKEWGIAGDAGAAQRVIRVDMTDNMRFSPDRIEVREGETVKLIVKNSGKMLHELVLGTPKELDDHAAMMLKHPGMEHDEAHMIHVNASRSGELVWNFNRPGEFKFACLIPGHYQAGMVGTIVVKPATPNGRNL